MPDQPGWLKLATSAVGRPACDGQSQWSLGTILVAINHGDAIVRGDLSMGRLLRIALTVMVPYCVSTYSSVSALHAWRLENTAGMFRQEGSADETPVRGFALALLCSLVACRANPQPDDQADGRVSSQRDGYFGSQSFRSIRSAKSQAARHRATRGHD